LVGNLGSIGCHETQGAYLGKLFVRQSEYNASEVGPGDGASAYRARLATRVHGRLRCSLAIELASSPARKFHLRMSSDVALGEGRIALFPEHFSPRVNQQRTKRHIARAPGQSCKLYGSAQMTAFCSFIAR
jgi:hypothetical protein